MPEASVDEDSHFRARECDIWTDEFAGYSNREVDAKSEAQPVKGGTERDFRLRVHSLDGGHIPSPCRIGAGRHWASLRQPKPDGHDACPWNQSTFAKHLMADTSNFRWIRAEATRADTKFVATLREAALQRGGPLPSIDVAGVLLGRTPRVDRLKLRPISKFHNSRCEYRASAYAPIGESGCVTKHERHQTGVLESMLFCAVFIAAALAAAAIGSVSTGRCGTVHRIFDLFARDSDVAAAIPGMLSRPGSRKPWLRRDVRHRLGVGPGPGRVVLLSAAATAARLQSRLRRRRISR